VPVKRLIDQPRRATYQIVLGIWLMLSVWAVLHDQYIVWIAPEHFKVYHEPLRNLESPSLIAAVYAIRAGFYLGGGSPSSGVWSSASDAFEAFTARCFGCASYHRTHFSFIWVMGLENRGIALSGFLVSG